MGITLYLPFKGHWGSVWQDFIACIERFVTGYDMMWGGTVDVYIVDWEVEMEVRSSVCCCCDWGYQKKKRKKKNCWQMDCWSSGYHYFTQKIFVEIMITIYHWVVICWTVHSGKVSDGYHCNECTQRQMNSAEYIITCFNLNDYTIFVW